MNGIIFDIKSFAVHDGPGIRTTVFLKGCPLACTWCHNPESISFEMTKAEKIIRIGNLQFIDEETIGREVNVDTVMNEILKDRIFMEESNGGVTFSGGEPLMQGRFLMELLKACKKEKLHTAVDTSGYASHSLIKKVAELTDLFLYDLKLMSDETLTGHMARTGVSNAIIHENLKLLLSIGNKVRIRLPMIPGISMTNNNISSTITFLKNLPHGIEGIDLLPFHATANHKYERFDLHNAHVSQPSVHRDELINIQQEFILEGFETRIGG